jgi:hypothetical protein
VRPGLSGFGTSCLLPDESKIITAVREALGLTAAAR